MEKVLIVVDMQNDFIDGALGTAEAVKIVPHAVEKIKKPPPQTKCAAPLRSIFKTSALLNAILLSK